LFITDIHAGKTHHFRKAGIPIPGDENCNLARLEKCFAEFPDFETLVILGDLFHSRENKGTDIFFNWRKKIPEKKFLLVKGNHDRLKNERYEENQIETVAQLLTGNLVFTHTPEKVNGKYNICGHLHPVFSINTGFIKGRAACFYFGKEFACLPSFGFFTGGWEIKPKTGDKVFLIGRDGILRCT
jgi:DNA ligase-associated metallophosphoesterase